MKTITARTYTHVRSAAGLIVLCAMALLTACGGGGGGGSSGPVAPTISTQPANQTVNDGTMATFTVVADAAGASLSYQWKRGTANIAGATAASYQTPALSLSDNGSSYSVVVTDSAGSVTSSSATVTVKAVAPTISTQPANQTVNDGSRASFSVVANGASSTLTYQWKKGSGTIAGATQASYTTPALTIADNNGSYTVDVSDSVGTVTSTAATVTVNAVAPTILIPPQHQTAAFGAMATFTVTASGGSSAVHYQWKNGNTNVGTDSASYTTPTLAMADNGSSYVVVVSDTAGSVTSSAATLTVNGPAGPTFTTQPSSQTLSLSTPGTTATFLVATSGGAPPVSYQWQKNGVNIVGATAASYTTPALTPSDNGNTYRVVASDSASNVVNSATATLTVTHTLAILAGKIGGIGDVNGTGVAAAFHYPAGVTMDGSGNLYVADTQSQTIRKIVAAVVSDFAGTPNVAGYNDATGTGAQFNLPRGVAVDLSTAAGDGNKGNLFVADSGNNRIRMITPGGVVTTFAGSGAAGSTDGTGNAAQFNIPAGVAVDVSGNVYVADSGNDVIRMITPAGAVSTFAGTGAAGSVDGAGNTAQFNVPTGVAVDVSGNVYVTDSLNTDIRAITSGGVVSTLAGTAGNYGEVDGTGTGALFRSPTGLSLDSSGDHLYIADYDNNAIRQVTTGAHGGTAGVVTTVAGSSSQLGGYLDAMGTQALFLGPAGTVVDAAGNVYVADLVNNMIREIGASAAVSTVAGNIGGRGNADGVGGGARFSDAAGIATDAAGNIYVADFHNNAVRKVTPNGVVSTLAGGSSTGGYLDGTGTTAQFNGPNAVAVDTNGNVYVADGNNFVIRMITPAGVVSTFAGVAGSSGSTDTAGGTPLFSHPAGVATDSTNNVYVADFNNNVIRMITPGGVVTTLAGTAGVLGSNDGTGAAAQFWNPHGIGTDTAGNIYVADIGNNLIRKITMPGAVVTTLAGNGSAGFANGTGSAAQFNQLGSVSVDGIGNIYVADYGNHSIRQVTQGGAVTTVAGVATSVGETPALSSGPVVLPASLNGPNGVVVLPGSVPGTFTKLAVAEETENSVLVVTLP